VVVSFGEVHKAFLGTEGTVTQQAKAG